MIAELGHFSLILAFCLSLLLAGLPLVGAARGEDLWMHLARPLTAGIFVFLGLSTLALGYAFATDDFSVSFVAGHSNSLLPLRYKLTALWGGHEGSFLLWTFMLSGWMLAVAAYSKAMPLEFTARVLGVLGMLCAAYILFMLATSNPFARVLPLPPADGADLNPALQDVLFIVHPPTLYMGYVGFSVVFAFAIAALLSGRLDTAWARWCRPWANVAWAILTLGIALGSWWAYYELGWGGWWAWDPVENPPLITWLCGTALIHSLAVTEKRGIFKSWTVLLAILAFAGSLLGTFITRSGLLTSVHAFASDPGRGVFILGILGLAVGGSLVLYALRAPRLQAEAGFGAWSRELLLLGNNILLVVAAATVLLGTLFPMLYQALTGDLISIGPPYFNTVFLPLMVLLSILLGIGPLCRWKRTSREYLQQQLWRVAVASVALGLLLPTLLLLRFSFAASLAVLLAAWIIGSMGKDLAGRVMGRASPLAALKSLPLSYYGMQTAHLGFAVMLLGVAFTGTFSLERSALLAPGQSIDLGRYSFTFAGTVPVRGPNYQAQRAEIRVLADGDEHGILYPERRVYVASGTPTTEMAIDASLWRDLFVTLGEERAEERGEEQGEEQDEAVVEAEAEAEAAEAVPAEAAEDAAAAPATAAATGHPWSMTFYIKPFVRWIWLGALFMAIGAVTAVADKRYRRLRETQAPRAALPNLGSA